VVCLFQPLLVRGGDSDLEFTPISKETTERYRIRAVFLKWTSRFAVITESRKPWLGAVRKVEPE
jgi:hypothetical protein